MKFAPHNQINTSRENISAILKSWGIMDFIMEELAGGYENTSLKINQGNNSYVLRVYQQSADKGRAQIEEELRFVDFLFHENISVPFLYPNIQGKFLSQVLVDGILWDSILMKFIDGEHIEYYTEDIVAQLGSIIGQLHLASLKYMKTMTHNLQLKDYEDEYINEISQFVGLSNFLNKNVSEFFARAKKFSSKKGDLPLALIHADITVDNFIVKAGQVAALIDFDDLHYGYIVNDIATTGRDILVRGNDGLLNVFLSAYNSVREISVSELGFLRQFMHRRNYLAGVACVSLFGENSQQLSSAIQTEDKINKCSLAFSSKKT